MNDFVMFKKMITPDIIIFVFWMGAVGCVGAALVLAQIQESTLAGLIVFVAGPILLRIWCEILIVVFAINGTLTDIKHLLERQNAGQ